VKSQSRSEQIFHAAIAVALLVLGMTARRASAADHVAGNLILFNDNGAWCWYQDERALVDQNAGTLLVASVAAAEGTDGKDRGGDVDLVKYDLNRGTASRVVLHHNFSQDDHNVPALLVRPDGRYLAMYTRHNLDNFSYWRISTNPHDASQWQPEKMFDWTENLNAVPYHAHVTYSNLFYLSAEKRLYDFSRAVNDDPTILTSDDQGETWTFGARLLVEPKLGYVNGYTKYASNGVDRIDFITTEHHPRDFNNSIYHGFIQGGKLHKSDGTVVDDDIFKSPGHPQTELTKIFAANSVFDGETMTHAWTMDLHLDGDGRPVALISTRANDQPENTNFKDHRFFYVRFDGHEWQVHPLAKAGACLWPAEQDYTGLAALDPSDVNVVYVSTTIDPRNGAALAVHEIFKGVTADGGQTWNWTPITQDSTVDNLRPAVPVWDSDHTALLWFRGTMSRSQHYDSAMVGIVQTRGQKSEPVEFVAAQDGSPGKASVGGLGPGTYDVFAFFWADAKSDQAIHAGLGDDRMVLLRRRFCQQAEASQFGKPVSLRDGERALYRGYLGRASLRDGQTLDVVVDDPGTGGQRMFAGIGYAPVAGAGVNP
jgi:hypothetical protein